MFCGRRCLERWEAIMAKLTKLDTVEELAVGKTLPALGAYVASVGMEKALQDYSKEEALGLARAAVCSFLAEVAALRDLNDEVPM